MVKTSLYLQTHPVAESFRTLRARFSFQLLLFFCVAQLGPSPNALLAEGRIVSEHVQVHCPSEREWLARATIAELENCWRFVRALTGALGKRILVVASWERSNNLIDGNSGSVTIGLRDVEAETEHFLHEAALGMAHLALLKLSDGRAVQEESRFIEVGMAEMIAHDFLGSNRELSGTWVVSHFLDRMGILGLETQASWRSFSGNQIGLRTLSPGVTFLMVCRELYGAKKTLQLFESLKKRELSRALSDRFKERAAVLEEAWLQRVRNYPVTEDVTVTSDSDAPSLQQLAAEPAKVGGSEMLELRLLFERKPVVSSSLVVFVLEQETGQTYLAKPASEAGDRWVVVHLPIDPTGRDPAHEVDIVAVDKSGNVRHWTRKLGSQQKN